MNDMVKSWGRMSTRSKTGIALGGLLIVLFAASLGWWAYSTDYQILFADVAPADAAAMTAELDKMKTPYQLADGGATILVPREQVYKTRLKLMGKEVPLHGAVGFEVFNNADFGMTEFVQKVNYQRAIQGELTRTILSIDDIQAARVHLALPEQGLFKKTAAKPKASVTVTMKNGRVLAPEQITGIQRLVAASVPDIVSGDVTVLDQHGVALTRVAGDGQESASTQLDAKRGAEEYLLKKVSQVLDQAYGAGEAVASVDVVLNLDHAKVTTEEILPTKSGDPQASATGVVVREKSSSSESGAGLGAQPPVTVKSGGSLANSTSEFDYQVGRRVEEVVAAGGAVKRMTIAVLVKQSMSEEQQARLKEVVALAAGFNSQRGDAVVVYSMADVSSQVRMARPALVEAERNPSPEAVVAPAPARGVRAGSDIVVVLLALAVAVAVIGVLLLARRGRSAAARMGQAERERMLEDVRRWIAPVADQMEPRP